MIHFSIYINNECDTIIRIKLYKKLVKVKQFLFFVVSSFFDMNIR